MTRSRAAITTVACYLAAHIPSSGTPEQQQPQPQPDAEDLEHARAILGGIWPLIAATEDLEGC